MTFGRPITPPDRWMGMVSTAQSGGRAMLDSY